MKERVFNITVQKNSRHNPETFSGVFVLDGDKMKGYVKKQNTAGYDPLRYIYGIYNDKDTDITSFIQLSMDQNIQPLIFAFFDIKEEGSWSKYDYITETFFSGGRGNGSCQISIEEVTGAENADALRSEAFRLFKRVSSFGPEPNFSLLSRAARNYMSLLYKFL